MFILNDLDRDSWPKFRVCDRSVILGQPPRWLRNVVAMINRRPGYLHDWCCPDGEGGLC